MRINLTEYFNTVSKKYADRTAIIEGSKTTNFESLYRSCCGIARCISETINGQINQAIAVYLPKSTESIQWDIGIIYSGNFYMNLDTKSPVKRIANILDLIKPAVVVTNAENAGKIKETGYGGITLITGGVLFNSEEQDKQLFRNLDRLIDTDPLCIINTSGSTGTPKGVVLNHRSFIDFTEWAIETLKIGDNEVIGSLSPLVFDIYSFELCMLMVKGSTIVLIPENQSAFPVNILKLMQETAVTFIFWVPTIMVNIANMDLIGRIPLPDLKTIWFAGEVFPTKQFNYWRKHLSGTKFVNLYGPIEITLDCTYYIAERELKDDEPIPIGFPCRNTDVLILTEDNQLAEIGEIGELCVRGTSLAMGYYNNPEKTHNAFVQNPLNKSYPELIYRTGDLVFTNENKEIIFKGRKDSLVKHLGYRIELGEIEHVIINTLKLVKNGCVVYDVTKKEIVLFYESDGEVPVANMRKEIGNIFPKYMVPGTYIRMEELPRNTNGKIDRFLLNTQINA